MIIGNYAAVLDACTLHPAFVRASLLWLADDHLFRPIWSTKILHEFRESLHRRFGDPVDKLDRLVALLNEQFPGALETYPAALANMLNLPDPNDNYVLAVAIAARADAIITDNDKDFLPVARDDYHIEVISPDRFLVNIIDLHEARAVAALRRQREQMAAPPYTAEDMLERYRRSGMIQTAARLEGAVALL